MLAISGCAGVSRAAEKHPGPFSVHWRFLDARGQFSEQCNIDPSPKTENLIGHEIHYRIAGITRKSTGKALQGKLHVEIHDPNDKKMVAKLGGVSRADSQGRREKLTAETEKTKHKGDYTLFCNADDEVAAMPLVILDAKTTKNANEWKGRFDEGWTLRMAQKPLVPENITRNPNRIFTPAQDCSTAPPMLPRQWWACPPNDVVNSPECLSVVSEDKWHTSKSEGTRLYLTLPSDGTTPKVGYSQYLWDWVKPDLGAKACSVSSKKDTPETGLTCRAWFCDPKKAPPPYTLNFGIPFVIDKALKEQLSQSFPWMKNLPDDSHWHHLRAARKEIQGQYHILDNEWDRIVKAREEQAKGKGEWKGKGEAFNSGTPVLPRFKPIEFPKAGTRAQLKPSELMPYYNLQGADRRPPRSVEFCQKTTAQDCDQADWQSADFTPASDGDWAFFTLPNDKFEILNTPIWIKSVWNDVSQPLILPLEEVTGERKKVSPPDGSSGGMAGMDKTLDSRYHSDTKKQLFYFAGDWPKDKLTPAEFELKLRNAAGQDIDILEWKGNTFTVPEDSISEPDTEGEFTVWCVRRESQKTAFSGRADINLSDTTVTIEQPKWHYHFLPEKLGNTDIWVDSYGGAECATRGSDSWLEGCVLAKKPQGGARLELDTGQEFKDVPMPPPGQPVELLDQLKKSTTEVRLLWPEKSGDGKRLMRKEAFPGGKLQIYSDGECPRGNPIKTHELSSVNIDPDSRLLSIKDPSYSAQTAATPLKISPRDDAIAIDSDERRSDCLGAERLRWRLTGDKELVLGIAIEPNLVREIIPLPADISPQDAKWTETGGCDVEYDGGLDCRKDQLDNEHILRVKRNGRVAKTFTHQGRDFRETDHYYFELPAARKLEISGLAFDSQPDQVRSECQSTQGDSTKTFDCRITASTENQSPPTPKSAKLKDNQDAEATLPLSNLEPGKLVKSAEVKQALGPLPLRWFGAQPLQQRFSGQWQVVLWANSATCGGSGSPTLFPLDRSQANSINTGLRAFDGKEKRSVADIASLRFEQASRIATQCVTLSRLPIRIENRKFFLALDLPAPETPPASGGTTAIATPPGAGSARSRTLRGREIVLMDVSREMGENTFNRLVDSLFRWQPDGRTPMDLWLQDVELWGSYSADDAINAKAALNEDLRMLVMTPSGLTPFEFLYRPLGSFLGKRGGHRMIAILGAGWANRKWDGTLDGREKFALLRTQMNQGDLDSLKVILLDDGNRPCERLKRNWGDGVGGKFRCEVARDLTRALERIPGM